MYKRQDVSSAVRQCKTITEDAMQIMGKLKSMSGEDSLPTWWTNKLAVASNSINKMRDYLLVPSDGMNEQLQEAMGDMEDLKKVVAELQNASKMHLAQSKRVQAHVDMMKDAGMDKNDVPKKEETITSKDLLSLGVIDEIISEPVGGAHRNPEVIADDIKHSIIKNLRFFENLSKEEVYDHRKTKFLKIGRDQGFSKSSYNNDTGLSYKGSFIQKLKSHIMKNKIIYLGIGLVFITGLVSIIY